ncbi:MULTISPECIES: hypothetical protein [unclassified Fibrobacter]|uniref:hypothetical protein n=1 Tax=unclassified Fibrobacter TaxID=2634177 RepID=UPI0025C02B25|nr:MULTISPECIES: hypothetical protein [unclassified Fibrobacter]
MPVNKYYTGDMNPQYPVQEQFANAVFQQAGVPWTSKCEDNLSPKGVNAGCVPKNEVYYSVDNGCCRVNLVLSTSLPIDHVSIEFLKIDPSKKDYQKNNLTDMEIKVVRKVFPNAKIKTFTNEGYPPSVRGLELWPLGPDEKQENEITAPATQSKLADALKKAVDLTEYLLRAEM